MDNIKSLNFVNFSAVLITTPQSIAVNDVRREITFCKKTGIPVAGIIENMSGFTCPNCKVNCYLSFILFFFGLMLIFKQECSYIFTKSGGKMLAEKTGCIYLGSIPIDHSLTFCIEKGMNFIQFLKESSSFKQIKLITDLLIEQNNNN